MSYGTYHKIHGPFKRDMSNKGKLLVAEWSRPEFEYLRKVGWRWTEKVDGTNIRIMIAPGTGAVTFGGKTDDAQIPAKLVKVLQDKFLPLQDILAAEFPDGACLYGEGHGKGIQKGGVYCDEQRFILFDVRVGQWWLQRQDVTAVSATLGIQFVPVIFRHMALITAIREVRKGVGSMWGSFLAEGLVGVPAVDLFARDGSRVIVKLKYKDLNKLTDDDMAALDGL